MKRHQYFTTDNKTFATTCAYLLNRKLFVMNRPDGEGIYYSFIWDDEFNNVLHLVHETRKQHRYK